MIFQTLLAFVGTSSGAWKTTILPLRAFRRQLEVKLRLTCSNVFTVVNSRGFGGPGYRVVLTSPFAAGEVMIYLEKSRPRETGVDIHHSLATRFYEF